MTAPSTPSNGQTRLAYILGVPLARDCQRQWPQMGEVVCGRDLIGQVDGNFPELTLELGRRMHLDNDIIVVEWTCNYGDGRLYRTSASPKPTTAKPPNPPTTGENPPPHPTGANP